MQAEMSDSPQSRHEKDRCDVFTHPIQVLKMRTGHCRNQSWNQSVPIRCLEKCKKGKPLFSMERAKGIEPSYAAWEATVLPLNYTRAGMHYTDLQKTNISRYLAVKAHVARQKV